MKYFICAFFTLLPLALAANSTQATESTPKKEIQFAQENHWRLAMAHMVAYQPAAIGWERFTQAMGSKPYQQAWKALSREAKKVKTWPTIQAEGNTLHIVEQGHPGLTVEAVFGEAPGVNVNGRIFTPTGKRPLIEELREFLAAETGNKNAWNAFSLIPEARAGDGAKRAVLYPALISFAIAANLLGLHFNDNGKYVLEFATVIGGFLLYAPSAMCGFASLESKGFWKHNPSFWGKFGLCLASPLSLLNKNWNDRLYLKDIDCTKAPITVELSSPNGQGETRTFNLDAQGRLRTVLVARSKQPIAELETSADGQRFESGETNLGAGHPKRLSRPKNQETLDEAQGLFRDFTYYKGLCQDDARRTELLRLLQRGEKGERAYDAQTPEQLNKEAQ